MPAVSLPGMFTLQMFTDLGELMASGRIYTFEPGTTTKKTAYTDSAGSVAHTYSVDGGGLEYIALNARGELPAPLFLQAGGYDIVLKDSAGVTEWTRRAVGTNDLATTLDTALRAALISTSTASDGAGLVGFDPLDAYAAATAGWWMRNGRGYSLLKFIPTSLHAGIIAGTNTTSLTSYLQDAFDAIDSGGGALYGNGYIYRCDTALDWRRVTTANFTQYRYAFIGDGSILDFRNSAVTSGALVKIGADAEANTSETGKIIVQGWILLGNDTASITANNARGGTTNGFEFTYCLNLVLDALHVLHCYKGYKTQFCFPIDARSVISQNCTVGLHVGSDCTVGNWTACGFRNGRFGILGMPDGVTGSTYSQVFETVNLEGNFVGCVIDPLNGTGVGVSGWQFINPYLETITYDGFRLGTTVSLSDASAVGADATRDIHSCRWIGGTWDAGGSAWGTAGHDAIRGPTSGSSAKPYSCRISIPVHDAGMTLVGMKDVELSGTKNPATGTSLAYVQAFGGHAMVRFDATGATGAKTLRTSKNVSGVNKDGTGIFTVTFSRAYKDADHYSATANAHSTALCSASVHSTAAGSCVIRTYDAAGVLADPSGDVSVQAIGAE